MSLNPSPGPSTAASQRQKAKLVLGITAGAEDEKYHKKYKDLKKTVKDIEMENDKLHFKILQAKRNIQRMKLERAILYERLSAVPASPDHQPLASVHQQPSEPASREQHNDDSVYADYLRTRPDPPIGSAIPQRRTHELRHLPPLPPLPSVQSFDSRHPHEHKSSRSRSHQLPYAPPGPQQYPEPPPQSVFHHSPPHSERRRPEIVDLTTPLAPLSPRPHSSDSRSAPSNRIHGHQRLGPGTYINRDEILDRDRELLDRERELEWRERARARAGAEISSTPMHSPPFVNRPYQDHHPTSRMRDDPGYYHDVPGPGGGGARGADYSRLSRSGTPGSGSGGSGGSAIVDGPSRPDSRGPPFYDHDQPQSLQPRSSFRLRPVSDDVDYVMDDHLHHHRSQSRDRGGGGGGFAPPQSDTRSTVESRKRLRHDMEVDDGPIPEPSVYPTHLTDDRGSKRYHRDHLHQDNE